MSKSRKHGGSKSGAKDFAVKKSRLGKKKVQPNQTTGDVRIKPVKLIEQKPVTRYETKGHCVTSRNLTLAELIAQTNHHNVNIRREAFLGIRELLEKFPLVLYPQLGHVLVSTAKSVADLDSVVRKQYRAVLERILVVLAQRGGESELTIVATAKTALQLQRSRRLAPFAEQLGLQLRSCITHRDVDIRMDALSFVELLLYSRALDLQLVRQIVSASVLDTKDRSFLVKGEKLGLLDLVTFIADLYERCTVRSLSERYMVQAYRVTRVALTLIEGGQKGDTGLSATPLAHDAPAGNHSAPSVSVKLSAWATGAAASPSSLPVERPSQTRHSAVYRLLETLLNVWTTLKEANSSYAKCLSGKSRWPDGIPQDALRLARSIVAEIGEARWGASPLSARPSSKGDASSALPAESQLRSQLTSDDVVALLTLAIRRDISRLVAHIMKLGYCGQCSGEGGVQPGSISQCFRDPAVSFDEAERSQATKQGKTFNAQPLEHRLVNGMFMDAIAADTGKSVATHRQAGIILLRSLRLTLMEAFAWFLSGPVEAATSGPMTAALCWGLLSACLLDFPRLASELAYAPPGHLREYVSSLSVYLCMIPKCLSRKNNRLSAIIRTLVLEFETHYDRHRRHLQTALDKISHHRCSGVAWSKPAVAGSFSVLDGERKTATENIPLPSGNASNFADVHGEGTNMLVSLEGSLTSLVPDMLQQAVRNQILSVAERLWHTVREQEKVAKKMSAEPGKQVREMETERQDAGNTENDSCLRKEPLPISTHHPLEKPQGHLEGPPLLMPVTSFESARVSSISSPEEPAVSATLKPTELSEGRGCVAMEDQHIECASEKTFYKETHYDEPCSDPFSRLPLCLVPIFCSFLGVSTDDQHNTYDARLQTGSTAFQWALTLLSEIQSATGQAGITPATLAYQLDVLRSPAIAVWLVEWVELAAMHVRRSPASCCRLLRLILVFVKTLVPVLEQVNVPLGDKENAKRLLHSTAARLSAQFFAVGDADNLGLFLQVASEAQRIILLLWSNICSLLDNDDIWESVAPERWITVLAMYPSPQLSQEIAFLICDVLLHNDLVPSSWRRDFLKRLLVATDGSAIHPSLQDYCSAYQNRFIASNC